MCFVALFLLLLAHGLLALNPLFLRSPLTRRADKLCSEDPTELPKVTANYRQTFERSYYGQVGVGGRRAKEEKSVAEGGVTVTATPLFLL